MDNETLVSLIQRDIDQRDNLLQLYNNNLLLIRKIAKPFTAFENEEDLLQESYFSLVAAVDGYIPEKGVTFVTYLYPIIKHGIIKYIKDSSRAIRLPAEFLRQIGRYKKYMSAYFTKFGDYPSIEEASIDLDLPIETIEEIILYQHDADSLDREIQTDSDSYTLLETIASDENIEQDSIDKLYAEHEQSALWNICQKYLTDNENKVIKNRFLNEQTQQQAAEQQGISHSRVQQLEQSALNKLRTRAAWELKQKLYIIENTHYGTGLKSFQEHDFTSEVERRVLRREQIGEAILTKYGYTV